MKSLNQRILFSASLVLFIFIVGTALTLDRAFYDSGQRALQDRMLGKLFLLMGEVEVDDNGSLSMPEELPALIEFEQLNSGVYAFITDQTNTPIWRSFSTLSIPIPARAILLEGEKKFEQITLNDEPHFIYSFAVDWETDGGDYPLTFHVIMESISLEAQIDSYRRDLWGWLGVMGLLLLIMQMLVLHWGLRPMRQVSSELNAVESGVQESVQGIYPVELKRLTDNINSLIQHERKHQQRYRNALADLAHSLKTPLTILRGASRTEKLSQNMQTVLDEQIDQMDSIIQYQLRRAATAGSSPGTRLTALRPVVEKIVNTVNRAHFEKCPEIVIEIEPELCLRMDEGDLMELLGNLIDNAFKWCRQAVAISAQYAHDDIVLKVEDDGPGIKQEEIGRLLERGVRADQAMPGHGIGLAIVRDIVQAYDGALSIGPSRNIGASFIIRIKR
ncbi:ATP-binding protein [Nitrosomonas sp. Nm33]|uniref:ATP-binding protein n=1 Tax=Nitrosomonas sp. Nm33 TaxID=133724 RepID=UPI0008963E22|nr:ATP-binding protein [Nitrosomonas sp. Nm33]SDY27645.1 two-component system, OmpR family, sensor histidine kinase PhoQ [Nitrosomonas sp. Nm33]